jgi:two-component system, NtrC family, response regulator GlrR
MLAVTHSAKSPNLIGRSGEFLRVLELIERMAQYEAPVLIVGETGTGKELAARAIHYTSARRDAPFVPLNCGAVPDTLIETELFGCERGAFTDARQSREGLVAAAEGGTLFLDEVDALPARAQVSLLRFLQERVYRPLGGVREHRSNVRVVAAASPRLQKLLHAGDFREDLMFRLMVLLLEMPPLRERAGDAELLAGHFIARHARHYGVPARTPDTRSREWLRTYAWPGNVRELDNLVQRALLLSDGEHLCLSSSRVSYPQVAGWQAVGAGAAPAALSSFNEARDVAMSQFERHYLERLMKAAGGNVTHAARMAGKERRAMGKLLKKYGLAHPGPEAAPEFGAAG